MSKLYFRYGAMNSGKSTLLLQVAHNYEERGMNVLVLKPLIDTKRGDKVTSRIGAERTVDYLISDHFELKNYLAKLNNKIINCVLVDEAQFLSPECVNELFIFSKVYNIPVICYGLRTDFRSELFPGSKRLFELADEVEELITICRCGKRAKFNGRIVDGKFTIDGEQVAIDGDVNYESLCGNCYIKKILRRGKY